MGSGSSKSKTHIKVLSREVVLTYLQSVQLFAGEADLGLLAGEGGGIGNTASSKSKSSMGFLGIGASSSSTSVSSSDSGWVISRTWRETTFDRVRYAIGLKDLGIHFYEFAEASEIVSVPFRSPKEILKVQVRAVEQIPVVFKPDRRYIEYYVSADNGRTWYRINPLDHPTIVDDDGQVVPRTLTFNAEVGGVDDDLNKFVETDEPVFALRYRAVLRTDPSIQDNERYTPVLKKVSLVMYPKGGLRDAA